MAIDKNQNGPQPEILLGENVEVATPEEIISQDAEEINVEMMEDGGAEVDFDPAAAASGR